jgi:hypothetical protein
VAAHGSPPAATTHPARDERGQRYRTTSQTPVPPILSNIGSAGRGVHRLCPAKRGKANLQPSPHNRGGPHYRTFHHTDFTDSGKVRLPKLSPALYNAQESHGLQGIGKSGPSRRQRLHKPPVALQLDGLP